MFLFYALGKKLTYSRDLSPMLDKRLLISPKASTPAELASASLSNTCIPDPAMSSCAT